MADGNGFSNKEILLRLEAKVDAALESHGERISNLEQFKARIKGGIAAVTGFAAIAIPIAALLLK